MRQLAIFCAVCALAFSSSDASGLARRHVEWWGKITGQNGSQIDGTVSMLASSDETKTEVNVQVKGARSGTVLRWRVRAGTCKKPGRIFGHAAWYTPLVANAGGLAKGLAYIPLPVPDAGDFFITIHESAAKMSRMVACANMGLED